MTANLGPSDRPFSEFSPFYSPPAPFTPSATPAGPPPTNPNLPASLSNLEISPRPPAVAATNPSNSDLKGRQHSIASSISSVGFEPGVDMSSFDASTTRAYPGRRGLPPLGMDGWEEDEAEDDVAKTWEEELDRRAKAGAELQRRTEAAAEREREERLQAEFWEEERRLSEMPIIEGPQKPPKLEPAPRQPTPESRPVPPPPAPPQLPARQPPPSATTTTEIYQIKHITWQPPAAPRSAGLRCSPILLQAANGPCPLLALVNALILSTPEGVITSLLSTLEQREQVSLELLLDAVFQELMDRGGAAGLPDVGDLFAFLLTLHTGMNVNPRFYPPAAPEPREYAGFEATREMELYGAFKIPLVHGWLPEPTHPVINAMKRRNIANYEEAQTLLFTEEEIINRVTTNGTTLLSSESQIIEDAAIIRNFMETSKTQLTPYGLDSVRSGLKPGDVAILFRNDHFMTVIGARDTNALHGLVTDAGFATHEEVVWESMADVSGQRNTFLSGDFRPVGGPQQQQQQQQPQQQQRQQRQQRQPHQQVQSLLDPDDGWEPIPESIRNERNERNDHPLPPPPSGDTTDHDADLALAMMLQEEENEAHRLAQEAARQRATANRHLSLLPGAPAPPRTPPRRTAPPIGVTTHRPADTKETTPPPPYERVPSSPGRPPATLATQRENMGAYQSMAAQLGHGRSPSAPLGSAQRAQAARGLLQEIAGSGAPASQGMGRRASGGAQGSSGSSAGGQGGGQRRQSISGVDDGKEKCVIC